jgi:two-component system, chemotaxis family, CheB/CheR fusion protein
MGTLREESAAANEELRAANEELQSINEEYRSTSEELETSKEELQSINEELTTVNTELKQRLEAVSRANSDLENLMAVTEVGTLFLDTGLRIRRFSCAFLAQRLSLLCNSALHRLPMLPYTHTLKTAVVSTNGIFIGRSNAPPRLQKLRLKSCMDGSRLKQGRSLTCGRRTGGEWANRN